MKPGSYQGSRSDQSRTKDVGKAIKGEYKAADPKDNKRKEKHSGSKKGKKQQTGKESRSNSLKGFPDQTTPLKKKRL
jgi:hypothetical protein